MRNEIVMVRFDNEEGKVGVLEGGIYHFDNKPMIVKAWTLETRIFKGRAIDCSNMDKATRA